MGGEASRFQVKPVTSY